MRKHDWADALARQIAADYGVRSERLRYDLVAARLRLVREEGVGIGLDQMREALKQPPKEEPR